MREGGAEDVGGDADADAAAQSTHLIRCAHSECLSGLVNTDVDLGRVVLPRSVFEKARGAAIVIVESARPIPAPIPTWSIFVAAG